MRQKGPARDGKLHRGSIQPILSGMKRLFATAVLFPLLAAPLWVLAQSNQQTNTQASAVAAQDDKQLNAAYQDLIHTIYASVPKGRADLFVGSLRESQRAWLKYREAQVDFVGTGYEGNSASARNAGLAQYNHELTQARIKDLRNVPDPF